jgi:transposase
VWLLNLHTIGIDLADGLQENGCKVHLANPSVIREYERVKHTNDR